MAAASKLKLTQSGGIDIQGITESLKALDMFENKVRKESIFNATRASMTPYVATAKQAAISGLTTLDSKARRKMASSIGIKSKNVGKTGRKAISWAIVGPVLGREFTSPRKRKAGKNGQFDYANMAAWFGGEGVKPHVTGSKGGMHPGIAASPVWAKTFKDNAGAILSRFNHNLTGEIEKAVKQSAVKMGKRQARQLKALNKALGGGE